MVSTSTEVRLLGDGGGPMEYNVGTHLLIA